MRIKAGFYVFLLTVASAIAMISNFNVLLSVHFYPAAVQDIRLPLSTLLLPFGACVWVAMDKDAALQATFFGMLVGLLWSISTLLYAFSVQPAQWFAFLTYHQIPALGFYAIAFVGLASVVGFMIGSSFFVLKNFIDRTTNKKKRTK